MAKTKGATKSVLNDDEFTAELIKSINTTLKDTCAYNLNNDNSPTNIKRFISTGSVLLDYIISNRRDGGVAESRLTEISGEEACGKSFIGYQILAQTQKAKGIAIYIDTENATDTSLIEALGIDVNKLVYLQPRCLEEVFQAIEHTIKKIKETGIDRPVTVVWDSVAATPPKEELDGDYDKNTVGLGARVISKGLRKIMNFIGSNRVTLVFINQLKTKVGASHYEDPWVTPYGKAIPFHATTRLRLTRKRSSDIQSNDKDFLGVGVKVKVIKNKICPPFRSCEFSIGFYKGVQEHNQLFEALVKSSPVEFVIDDKKYQLTAKGGAWHKVSIAEIDDKGVTTSVTPELIFRKTEILDKVLNNADIKKYIDKAIDVVLYREYTKQEIPLFDASPDETDTDDST
jgi:recombination protein RecA